MMRFATLSLLFLILFHGSPIKAESPFFLDTGNDRGAYAPNSEEDDTLLPEYIVEDAPTENLIYLAFENLPKKLYIGQIFPVTIKVTSLMRRNPYQITLHDGENVELIKEPEEIAPRPIAHLTYYFKALGPVIRIPDFIVSYEDDPWKTYTLPGEKLSAVRLNPPKDFCQVLAHNLELENFQASAFKQKNNILALQLKISYGNFDDFHLNGAIRQGIDSYSGDINDTTLFYYAVFPSDVEQIRFSYFNLESNRYKTFEIPIIVKRSSVSTQSDLDPQESEFTKFKIAATIFFIALWLLLWIKRKRWTYLVLVILASAYLLTYLMPLKKVCIEEESALYLLPTPQSTPFMRLSSPIMGQEMNRKGGYTKVRLPNNTIGWVKNENLCTH
ncbi:hypothetical protein [Hydrogenimonas sp.]